MSPEVVIKIPEEPDIRGEFIDSGVWEGPQMHLKTLYHSVFHCLLH